MAIAFVAVEDISEFSWLRVLSGLWNATTVNKIEVGIRIGIVNQKRTTPEPIVSMICLCSVLPFAMFEVDACFFRDIHEDRWLCGSTANKYEKKK